jgi:serine/threonine protein kinase
METGHRSMHDGTSRDLSGMSLAGYRLGHLLGSGGMADVYVAEQTSLGRRVAIKVLRPETLRHVGAVERFEQEARAAAALVHGNIVQIHEVACLDGIHFLAEEFVEGPSLAGWLEVRGPLDARQALAVLAQVGSALARAARQGIVHRDIKPANLLVTPAGEVKVTDFGLARVVAEDLALTQSGTTLGTPLYMSPEQGEGRAVDARSDLYSLGATVYHLLAGRPPFTGPTAVSVVMAHIREPLEPLGRLRPDLPAEVCAIVERLLAKDPAERLADPAALLDAVAEAEAALGGLPRATSAALEWQGEWQGMGGLVSSTPTARAPQLISAAGGPARGPLPTLAGSGVREATQRLRQAIEAEAATAAGLHRRRLLTGVAAAVAAVAGFGIGRLSSRRTSRLRP